MSNEDVEDEITLPGVVGEPAASAPRVGFGVGFGVGAPESQGGGIQGSSEAEIDSEDEEVS